MLAGIDVACFDVRPMRVRTLRLPFDITIALPGSKSVALRAIVAACLAEGRTTIVDATPCDDVLALVDGLAKLGFRIRWFAQDDGILDIEGGLPEGDGSATALIDCGAGGAPLRFLSAVATLCPGTWTLTGNARLQQRPIAALCDALRQLGAQLDDTDGHAPLTIRGGGMHGGPVALDASTSSQHLSALLLIGSLLGSGIESGIAFDGRSLLPMVRGEVESHESEFYITECTWMRKHGWRTPQWKLIEALEPDFHFKPAVELYNLVEDPGELVNLAEAEPEMVDFLRKRRDAWVAKREQETGLPNPIHTQGDWHGIEGIGPFKTSQQAYDTLHIGDPGQAAKLQAEARK